MIKNFDNPWLIRLGRIEQNLFAVLRFLLICITAAMVVAVLAQVFSRYALNFSLNWSEELARICMICLVFLGAAVLSRDNEHLAVTTVIEVFPRRLYHFCVAGAQLVGLYCVGLLANGAWSALGREWSQLTPALQVPFGFVYSTIFFAVCLMLIWLFINLIREVTMALGCVPAKDAV